MLYPTVISDKQAENPDEKLTERSNINSIDKICILDCSKINAKFADFQMIKISLCCEYKYSENEFFIKSPYIISGLLLSTEQYYWV